MAFSFEKHPVVSTIATGFLAWQTIRFGLDFNDYVSAATEAKQNERAGLAYPYENAVLDARMKERTEDAADALIFGGIAGAALFFATKESDSSQ